jgi:hypothetical protein
VALGRFSASERSAAVPRAACATSRASSVPSHFEPIRRKGPVEAPERSVEVGKETDGPCAEAHEVQPRVADEERVVRPRHRPDSPLETPVALEELEAHRDVAAAPLRPDREQVRVVTGNSEVDARKTVDEAHHLPPVESAHGQTADVPDDLEVESGGELTVLESPDLAGDLLDGNHLV